MLTKISIIHNWKKTNKLKRPKRLWLWVDIQCWFTAIFQLVYQFGIPNSDPQTLKSLKIDSSKNRKVTAHALVPQCFELLRRQNIQNFPGLCPWTPLGRAYSTPHTPQLHNGFSAHYVCQETGTSQKLLDTALIFFHCYKLNFHQVQALASRAGDSPHPRCHSRKSRKKT